MLKQCMLSTLLTVIVTSLAFPQTPADRINDFFLEMSILAERYSCTGFITSFTAEEVDQRSNFMQVDFRRVVDQENSRNRADIRTETPAEIPGYFVFEHYLKTSAAALSSTHVIQGKDIKALSKDYRPQPPAPATINWTLLPVFSHGCLGSGIGDTEEGIAKGNIVCERLLPKSRKAVYVAHEANVSGMIITFAPEPTWLVEEIVFVKSPQDKFGNIIKPETSELVSEKEMLTWKPIGSTKTDWIRQGEKWLPRRCVLTFSGVMYRDQQRTEFESTSEVLFSDWKIGRDVDLSLLDEGKFTTEEIQRTINFDQWRAMATELNRRRSN